MDAGRRRFWNKGRAEVKWCAGGLRSRPFGHQSRRRSRSGAIQLAKLFTYCKALFSFLVLFSFLECRAFKYARGCSLSV